MNNISHEEELYLELCKNTKGSKKIIAYSHQEWDAFPPNDQNIINYQGIDIQILDRDEAIADLKAKVEYNIDNSIVAFGESRITNSKNV